MLKNTHLIHSLHHYKGAHKHIRSHHQDLYKYQTADKEMTHIHLWYLCPNET